MNLRFYLFVSGVNQGNEGRGGEFKISLCYPMGLGAFLSFIASEVAEFSACGVFVDD